LRAGPGLLVAVDFDGTLSPIVGDPLLARPAPGAVEILAALSSAGCSVAVVTGRPAGLVVELGGLQRVPGLVVLGSYGAQRWSGGHVASLVSAAAGLPAARRDLVALAVDGVTFEDKDLAVAMHTRRAADPRGAFEALLPIAVEVASRHGLVLEPGSLVLELRTPGPDKGDALRALLPGMASVFFAGDDEGDVAAVRAVRESGLPSTCVCVAREDGSATLQRLADLVVGSPGELVGVLEGLL